MNSGVDRSEFWAENGYWVERALFTKDECSSFIDHFMELRGKGEYWGDFPGVDPSSSDPLLKYPRMIHMHRWDSLSRAWVVEPRIGGCFASLLDELPIAVQTMLYFKPPGARGQALHQDQTYLRARPGTCYAAWLALDDCDEENGCLAVVPGSHRLPLLCTEKADLTESFTDVAAPLPPGASEVPMVMKSGDCLFFHGNLIHGSHPNRTSDRFRRSLIGHYIDQMSEEVAAFYHPAIRFDGDEPQLAVSPEGGPCGRFVAETGELVMEAFVPRTGPEHE